MALMSDTVLPAAWLRGLFSERARRPIKYRCPPNVRWLRREAAGFRRLAAIAIDADDAGVYRAFAEALDARADSLLKR